MIASPVSPPSTNNPTGTGLADRDFWPTVAVIAVAGFVLRLCGASGDLGIDEIWSHELLRPLTSIDQVFWKISHDNNHFLNSAWLYLTGPDASVFVQRMLSILMGTASVFAAAAVTADRGRTTQLVAALFFAMGYPVVQFGSEARGYGALVLFSLIAIWATQATLNGRKSPVVLSAAILFGFLSHLTMAATLLALVLWTFATLARREGGLRAAAFGTIRIFLPPLFAILPLAASIAYGAWNYGFTIGGVQPFALASFSNGYGRMTAYLVGVTDRLPYWWFIPVAFGIVIAAARAAPGPRTVLYATGAIGFPLILVALRLPNLEFPRYYTTAVVMLLLAAAELFGRLLDAGGRRRIFAALALALYLGANGLSLWRFLQFGRGTYADVVAEKNLSPNAEYASSNAFRTQKIVNFYQRNSENRATAVRIPQVCERRPEWYVEEVRGAVPYADDFIVEECGLVYDIVMFNRAWGLSSIGWALYRLRY